MSNGSINKKQNPTPEKGIKNNEKEEEEEEEERSLRYSGMGSSVDRRVCLTQEWRRENPMTIQGIESRP
jgi:hypothetical protein